MPKNFVRVLFCAVFQKKLGSENLHEKKEGEGVDHDFLSKLFCLTEQKHFAGEPSSLSLVWGIEKNSAQERYISFLSNMFCLTISKNMSFTKFLVSKNVRDKEKGYHDFPSSLFCLTAPNHFAGGTIQCAITFGYRNFFCLTAFTPVFLSVVFCLTLSKNSVGEPFCFTNFLLSKIFMDKRGERGEGGGEGDSITISFRKILAHSAQKNS